MFFFLFFFSLFLCVIWLGHCMHKHVGAKMKGWFTEREVLDAQLEALFERNDDARFEKGEIICCNDFEGHAQYRLQTVHQQLVLILPEILVQLIEEYLDLLCHILSRILLQLLQHRVIIKVRIQAFK
jgi:hypothetical protein